MRFPEIEEQPISIVNPKLNDTKVFRAIRVVVDALFNEILLPSEQKWREGSLRGYLSQGDNSPCHQICLYHALAERHANRDSLARYIG